jgi:anti-sigma factor RsiW
MDCDAQKKQLGPYLDDELRPEARHAVEAHLAACPACRTEYESLHSVAVAFNPRGSIAVPQALWGSIEARLDRASVNTAQRPATGIMWRLFRRPLTAAASIVLVVGLGVLGFSWLGDGSSTADASVIDFSVLLDALPADPREAFRKFLIHYGV